jgi:hypothetical protein
MSFNDRERREKNLERLRTQAAVFAANRDERKREAELARIKAEETALVKEEVVEDADESAERRRLFWQDE